MSLYVEWLNKIKALATSEWLTDAQGIAFGLIVNEWRNMPFVCLYGPPGSGKTFIGRLLAREKAFAYVRQIRELPRGIERVVVDGEEYSRMMRPAARLAGVKQAVIIMRRPPRDPMPSAEVALTSRDVRQFKHNLTKHGVLQAFITSSELTDLGQILRAEAIARGELNGGT